MKALRVNGGSLAYDVRGEGREVLLLHAFPLHSAMWEPQVQALAGSHRVVRVDARGFGGSSRAEGLLTMERVADDAAAVLDHLGLASAVVCGLSMGGYAAFALWRRRPERVRALVLADTRAAADAEAARESRAALAERVRREGPVAAAEAMVPKLLGSTSQRERHDLVAQVRDMVLGADPGGIAEALAGLAARADSTATLRTVTVPTLVVCGAEDTLTPPAEAEAMQQAIRGAILSVIPAAGHLSNLENPAAFNAALGSFLRTLGA